MRRVKISVITIIYRVEPYLRQCLDSLAAQTYDGLEFILVVGVDGSDRCEEICDEYAAGDARFKVVKSRPQGVADARNRGLLAATGDYIGFVDGDDWASPDMFSYLYGLLDGKQADIAVCGKFLEYGNGADYSRERKVYDLTPEQAFSMILYQDGFFLHLWDKLFKREIFEGITFPVKERIEDRKIGYKLLSRANRIVYGAEPKIHFRVSEDSGSRVADNLVLSLEADREMCAYLSRHYPDLDRAIRFFMVYETISVIQNNMLYGTYGRKKDGKYLTFVRKNALRVMGDKKVSTAVKGKILICCLCPALLKALTAKRRERELARREPYSGLSLNQVEHNQVEHNQAEHNQAEHNQAEHNQDGHNQAEHKG